MPDRSRRWSAASWLHPGWSWTVRFGGAVGVAWGLVTLLLGSALGGVYSLATGDWHSTGTWTQLWLTIGLAAAAAGIAAWCLTAFAGRRRMLRRNGTAYIVREQARGWSRDEAARFLAESRRQFARVIEVPGPGVLDGSWDWPLDEDAARWDAKLAELAVAFRALNLDDNPGTPNGIFIWAWWAVAMAFGTRITAADRGLVLDVWQRPSTGRTQQQEPVPWSARPHRFGAVTAALSTREFSWPVRLTVTRQLVVRTVWRDAGTSPCC